MKCRVCDCEFIRRDDICAPCSIERLNDKPDPDKEIQELRAQNEHLKHMLKVFFDLLKLVEDREDGTKWRPISITCTRDEFKQPLEDLLSAMENASK